MTLGCVHQGAEHRSHRHPADGHRRRRIRHSPEHRQGAARIHSADPVRVSRCVRAPPRTHAELLDLLRGIGFTTHEYINFIAKTLKLETGIITAYKSPNPIGHIRSMTQTTIQSIHAREILDSRGNPTLEAEVVLDGGATRPRRGSDRRIDRFARSSRASRRRQDALSRQGRFESSRQRQWTDRCRAQGFRCRRSGRARPQTHRSRRHAEQGQARRQRAARRFARERACTRGRERRAALETSRRESHRRACRCR